MTHDANKLRMKIKGMTCHHCEVSVRVKSTSLGQAPVDTRPAQAQNRGRWGGEEWVECGLLMNP